MFYDQLNKLALTTFATFTLLVNQDQLLFFSVSLHKLSFPANSIIRWLITENIFQKKILPLSYFQDILILILAVEGNVTNAFRSNYANIKKMFQL